MILRRDERFFDCQGQSPRALRLRHSIISDKIKHEDIKAHQFPEVLHAMTGRQQVSRIAAKFWKGLIAHCQ